MIRLYQYNIRNANVKELTENITPSDERVIIKTCWRFEAYIGNGYVPEEVVRHLFRVTSGLDSPVLGDGAIQNQVKKAYHSTCAQFKLDKFMHRLFQVALQTGKIVRSSTSISRGAMSYAQAIYKIINNIEKVSNNAFIIVVGVNNITRSLLKFLSKKGFNNLLLLNRSLVRARQLANEFQIPFGSIEELKHYLKEQTVLIAALAAPESVIEGDTILNKTHLIIDIGVPSNIKIEHQNIEHVKYYNIDAVENIINHEISYRKNVYEEAMLIVEQKIKEFMQWQESTLRRELTLQRKDEDIKESYTIYKSF